MSSIPLTDPRDVRPRARIERSAGGISSSREPEFPGCHPITLTREDLPDHEGRFEYRDGDTETAWVVSESTSATHEHPSTRLAGLGHVIAGVRGAPIECFGTMDLLLRNKRGEKWRIMQADQTVYFTPGAPGFPPTRWRSVGTTAPT